MEHFEAERRVEFLHEMTVSEDNMLDNMKETAVFIVLLVSESKLRRFEHFGDFDLLYVLFSSKRLCSHFWEASQFSKIATLFLSLNIVIYGKA